MTETAAVLQEAMEYMQGVLCSASTRQSQAILRSFMGGGDVGELNLKISISNLLHSQALVNNSILALVSASQHVLADRGVVSGHVSEALASLEPDAPPAASTFQSQLATNSKAPTTTAAVVTATDGGETTLTVPVAPMVCDSSEQNVSQIKPVAMGDPEQMQVVAQPQPPTTQQMSASRTTSDTEIMPSDASPPKENNTAADVVMVHATPVVGSGKIQLKSDSGKTSSTCTLSNTAKDYNETKQKGAKRKATPTRMSAAKASKQIQIAAHTRSPRVKDVTLPALCPICKGPGRKSTSNCCSTCYSGIYHDISKVVERTPQYAIQNSLTIPQFVEELKRLPRGCIDHQCGPEKYAYNTPRTTRCTRCRSIATSRIAPGFVRAVVQKVIARKLTKFEKAATTFQSAKD
eukprot:m.196346 g.196346  ORF g.196346 m.196346 type:complete len:406 (+) comp14908_c1_seq8:112-1329(+)